MSGRMFYRVNRVLESGGLSMLELPKLLTEGRAIRWRSIAAEYGLFEAVVCQGRGEVNVRDERDGRKGEISYERVAEVCLTREEAQRFGFGFPS